MAITQTHQVRNVVMLDNAYKYKVDITVTTKGDLPSASIFTIQIVNDEDPKDDLFTRVAAVGDFDQYPYADRASAVLAGSTYYRASGWTFYYDSVDTAAAAQVVLKENVDTLVEDYQTYLSSFVTVSEDTDHPQLSTPVFMALVEVYTTARTATETANAAVETTKETYDAAVADAATAATAVVGAATRASDFTTTQGWFNDLRAALNALKAAGDLYYALKHASPTDAADSTFSAALLTALTVYTQAGTQSANIATMCTTRVAEYNALQAAKTNADLAVAAARTAYENAQAAYVVAQRTEEAALAAIRALKPSFDPANV